MSCQRWRERAKKKEREKRRKEERKEGELTSTLETRWLFHPSFCSTNEAVTKFDICSVEQRLGELVSVEGGNEDKPVRVSTQTCGHY